jgi:hypothetical protein
MTMRHRLAALLATAILALPAQAVTFATDATDLWWIPSESGWGANVIQQGGTLFMTLFVYDASGKPTWYVGSEVKFARTNNNELVYTGTLFQTSGPYFGAGSFNPSSVTVREVGTVTFTLNTLSTATINYVADNVSVTKAVTRQTWGANNLQGSYIGGSVGSWSGCRSGNGLLEENGSFSIDHQDTNFRVATVMSSGSCTFLGTYGQSGRMGSASGAVSCTANTVTGLAATTGTFTFLEIDGSVTGASFGRGLIQLGACTWQGRLGGVRRG